MISSAGTSLSGERLDQVWERLSGLHSRVEQELVKGLRRTGLGLSEYRSLAHLDATAKREIRMLDLADLLALNQSSISRLVARLEALGYVYREACGDDRRGVYVVINDVGRDALAAATPTYRQVLDQALTREVGFDQVAAIEQALLSAP